MKGWTVTKIIVRLWIAAAACAAIGFAIYYRDRGGLPIA
jgi:UDP-N-acetylmuramyl pentapeptide phosphotransferase/UDP-N-acetylglucosamine-1-phosphate transferase